MHKHERGVIRAGLLIASFTLSLAASTTFAKISAKPGEDGAPPDPQDEALAQEYNDLLDGPKDGQSLETWQTELDTLHDELYPEPKPDEPVPHGPDLCVTPISDWMDTESDQRTAEALTNAKTLSEVKHNLALYFQYVLQFETESVDNISIPLPTVTDISCAHCSMTFLDCLDQFDPNYCKKHYLNCAPAPLSSISVEVPIFQAAGDPYQMSDNIYLGTIHVEASMFHTDLAFYEWCVNVSSYTTEDFSALALAFAKPKIDAALEDSPYCFSQFSGQEVPIHFDTTTTTTP